MAEVQKLRVGAPDGDTTKAQFLDHVAAAYDNMVAAGEKPDSIVYSVASLHGAAAAGWLIVGPAEGASDAVVCRAIECIRRQNAAYGT